MHRTAAGFGLTLALLLGACGAPAASSSPSARADHLDPVAEMVKAELSRDLAMSFEPAGPHHTLGKAPNGVQLDLVGVPTEEVVLSIPAGEPGRVAGLASPYLPYLQRLLVTPITVGPELLLRSLAGWDGSTPLKAARVVGGIGAEVSSGGKPPYVVLAVHR